MLAREDARRKCDHTVVVEIECGRGEERGNDNGMEMEWKGNGGK